MSQESGRIVNISRSGTVSSSLTITADPGDTITVPAQQHEGLTMDFQGNLYIVSENGGGDVTHPQLWVSAPSSQPNQAPTGLTLTPSSASGRSGPDSAAMTARTPRAAGASHRRPFSLTMYGLPWKSIVRPSCCCAGTVIVSPGSAVIVKLLDTVPDRLMFTIGRIG